MPRAAREREDEREEKRGEERAGGVLREDRGAEEAVDRGHGREREDEPDGEGERRVEKGLARGARRSQGRERRREERAAHEEQEHVAPVPGGRGRRRETPRRAVAQEDDVGRTVREESCGLGNVSRGRAIHEEKNVAGPKPGGEG